MKNQAFMLNFRKIPRMIMGLLTPEETYLYVCLCFKSDFENGESHVSRKTLCDISGIKKEDTITKYTNKFQNLGLIEKVLIPSELDKMLAAYRINIPDKDWIRIEAGFLDEDLSPKLKGFLVLFKCLCLNCTEITLYNKTGIAGKLNMDRKTVSKYLDEAINLKRIFEVSNGYRVADEFILTDYIKNFSRDATIEEQYQTICDYCWSKGCIPPQYDSQKLKRLNDWRFRFSKAELDELINESYSNEDKKSLHDYYNLEYNLKKSCKNLPPKIGSLDYFLKALIQHKDFYKYRNEGMFKPKKGRIRIKKMH